MQLVCTWGIIQRYLVTFRSPKRYLAYQRSNTCYSEPRAWREAAVREINRASSLPHAQRSGSCVLGSGEERSKSWSRSGRLGGGEGQEGGAGRGKASSFPVSPCPSACLQLPHLCLLRSQPALLQEPGQREKATSGSPFTFPLDWCRGSQTLVDPEALPVLGELVEPDPAARPLPSLLAVICPPLWLTSPHDPQSLACPEGFQTRSATYLAMHLSLRQPTLLLESPWVSPGAEGTPDAPSRAAVWMYVQVEGRAGHVPGAPVCQCQQRASHQRPQQLEKAPRTILCPASWASVL